MVESTTKPPMGGLISELKEACPTLEDQLLSEIIETFMNFKETNFSDDEDKEEAEE
jgi:hypothetical protein